VDHQQEVAIALRQLTARLNEVERFVARSMTYYHDQAKILLDRNAVTLEAVRQANALHEHGNGTSSAVYARCGEVVTYLEAATRAYRENTVVRQQAARSWLVRAVYTFNQHREAALVGVLMFSACVAAFGLVEFLTR